MSKKSITLIVICALVVLLGGYGCSSYNGMVQKDEAAATAWSNVQSQYQRRADLIPNLVNTVKGYAKHESETLESVVAARAKATQLTVDADQLTPEKMQQIQAAQGELSQALGRLLMLTENYPDLKANENFRDLQAQLEGTENRIATERMKFNDTAREYNTNIRKFPNNIVASLFDFEPKGYFEAKEGADVAPVVEF